MPTLEHGYVQDWKLPTKYKAVQRDKRRLYSIELFFRVCESPNLNTDNTNDSLAPPRLSANEIRVIGCLMEKSVVTPDQYPLTLNALTNACNQKSSRNPVMSLQQGMVQRTVRDLEAKHLLRVEENFKRGVEKYSQRFCNSRYSDYQFDAGQFAIVCLLMLRGPQTPGELRANSGRLHSFTDNAAVFASLTALIERERGPVVVQLPRTPGRKDAEYTHLFAGPVDLAEYASSARNASAAPSSERTGLSELVQRIEKLETEVAELKVMLQSTER
jgi:uncharacterized protein